MIPSSIDNLGVTNSIIPVRLTLKYEKIVPDNSAGASIRSRTKPKPINCQLQCTLISTHISQTGYRSHLRILIFVIILSAVIEVDNYITMATPLAGTGEGMGFQGI
jgi:hypothetical protein